jgi:hypothetical protein
MKIIIFLIILGFAVFGFSEFLHLIKLKFIFPKAKLYAHLVINLQNDTAEKQLLYVCEQYNWHGKSFADFIVPFCDNLDNDTFERTREIAQNYGVKLPERI